MFEQHALHFPFLLHTVCSSRLSCCCFGWTSELCLKSNTNSELKVLIFNFIQHNHLRRAARPTKEFLRPNSCMFFIGLVSHLISIQLNMYFTCWRPGWSNSSTTSNQTWMSAFKLHWHQHHRALSKQNKKNVRQHQMTCKHACVFLIIKDFNSSYS